MDQAMSFTRHAGECVNIPVECVISVIRDGFVGVAKLPESLQQAQRRGP
jgi:hypothetical protein